MLDEARFGLHTVVRHCWGLRGERVVRPFQQRFEWEYLYGAIGVLDGEAVFCHMPTVTCETSWEFLRQIAKTQPDSHHVILWDGAGFHQPPPLSEAGWADLSRVHTVKLPPYCPELNPTEKLWDALRDEICNEAFPSLEALRDALRPKLQGYWENLDRLTSLIGVNWLRQKANNGFRVNLPVFN